MPSLHLDNVSNKSLLNYGIGCGKYGIIKNSEPSKRKTHEIWPIEIYDSWLPDDAKFGIEVKIVEQAYGQGYEMIGIFRMEANLFANPEFSAYMHGGITPLKNGYISLELQTM